VVEDSITVALVAFFRSDEVVKVGMRRLRPHLLYGLKGAPARYWHSADGPSVVSIAAEILATCVVFRVEHLCEPVSMVVSGARLTNLRCRSKI